ncbi:thioredoxin family protein [Larkinella terrae]|uniref:Thioredoxin n=1 Tax=Larkinella terrae TaxID=2025311 RepID=A0A7K0ETU1_9BACT|nr:thioredoxin family protein [Larkinella terrae]MRS65230.1 thioredoxin fold domain-containing protein [Larkinella terrae]
MNTGNTKAVFATDQNWDELVAKPGVLLVDFSAEWCPPCRRLEPIINELAADFTGTATVATIDVEMNPSVTVRYNVRNMPTILVFKDGELVNRHLGFTTKQVLAGLIETQMTEPVLTAQ